MFICRSPATEEVRLINDMMSKSRHHAHHLARPIKDISKSVTVAFGLSLVQLLDFDEKNQIIVLSVWKHYVSRFEFWQKLFITIT